MEEKTWHRHRWPAGVARHLDFPEKPVPALLEETAKTHGALPYLVFQGRHLSFAEVDRRANQVAHFLRAAGVAKGDRVALSMPNIPQFPIVYFGILKAGAVAVPCNPLYKERELRFLLTDSGAKVLFVMDHPEFYPIACQAAADTGITQLVYCSVGPYLPRIKAVIGGLLGKIPTAAHHPLGTSLESAITGRPTSPLEREIDPKQDPAIIIYTGGTTGVPKGAVLTHYNLVSNVIAVDEWVRLVHTPGGQPERFRRNGFHTMMGVVPWSHVYGHTHVMLVAPFIEARLICLPDPRAGKPPFTELLEAIEHYHGTILHGVPTLFTVLLHHPHIDRFHLDSLIGCASAAAALPVELALQFEARTGCTVFEAYGMTEAAPLVTANPSIKDLRKLGSVGLPIPGTDLKILDSETGTRELAQGEDGEIAVSGPQVMQGYWKKPEEDAVVFRVFDGQRFFLTGDVGHIDQDGFIFITDRKKDMIDVGGLKAYPREIEEVLYMHPKVAQAAVIGVADEKSGQVVKAFVQLTPGVTASDEEIIDFCRDKLAGYKRPRMVEFREQLPMSPVGKILRRALRDPRP